MITNTSVTNVLTGNDDSDTEHNEQLQYSNNKRHIIDESQRNSK